MNYSDAVELIIKRYSMKDTETFPFAVISQILLRSFTDEDRAYETLQFPERYQKDIIRRTLHEYFESERVKIFCLLMNAIDRPSRQMWDVLTIPFQESFQIDTEFEKRTELSRKFLNSIRFKPINTAEKVKQSLYAAFLKHKDNDESIAFDCRQLLKELMNSKDLKNLPKIELVPEEPTYIRAKFSEKLYNDNLEIIESCCKYASGKKQELLEYTVTVLLEESPLISQQTLTLIEETFERNLFKTAKKRYNISDFDGDYGLAAFLEDDAFSTLYEFRGSSPIYYRNIPRAILERAAIVINADDLRNHTSLEFQYYLSDDLSTKKVVVLLDCDKVKIENKEILFDLLNNRIFKDFRFPAQTLVALEIKNTLPNHLSELLEFSIHA